MHVSRSALSRPRKLPTSQPWHLNGLQVSDREYLATLPETVARLELARRMVDQGRGEEVEVRALPRAAAPAACRPACPGPPASSGEMLCGVLPSSLACPAPPRLP